MVALGIDIDGVNHPLALVEGSIENATLVTELCVGLRERGLDVTGPVLVVLDGSKATGGERRVRPPGDGQVSAALCRPRHKLHKIGNVLAALPKSAHPGAKAALAEIYNVEDREHALKAAEEFADLYGAKWPKAVAKVIVDLDVLLAFYDYPAEHWIHLRTTNPIWVHLRHRPATPAGHQGPRLTGGRDRDGLQAHRASPTPLARGERAAPRCPGPSRSQV